MLAVVGALMAVVAAWHGAEPEVEAARAEIVGAQAGAVRADLRVGDRAPALAIAKWIKGRPVERFEPGKVYLVEFWATWCPPCRKNIPTLSALQARYRDKGLVVIGVTAQEMRGFADVEPFVAKQGDRIGYTIAWDNENRSTRAYLEAAGIDGIPTAFLIEKTGRVAWIGKGYPMRGLEEAVERVVNGTFDLETAAAEAKRRAEVESRARPLLEKAEEAHGTGELARALEWLEKAIALDPVQMGPLAYDKFRLLAVEMKELDRAYAFAAASAEGPVRDQPQVLNAIAWMILDDPGLEKRDVGLALRMSERANALTEGKAAEILDTLARALYETGERERAVELQRRAVELAEEEDLKRELKGRLQRYEGKK